MVYQNQVGNSHFQDVDMTPQTLRCYLRDGVEQQSLLRNSPKIEIHQIRSQATGIKPMKGSTPRPHESQVRESGFTKFTQR